MPTDKNPEIVAVTSMSLLERVKTEPTAFPEFWTIYQPWIYRLLRHVGLQHEDAEDTTQDVFLKVSRAIGEFTRERPGSFREWLKTITRHRVAEQNRKKKFSAAGGTDNLEAIQQVENSCDELSALWDREYEREVASGLLRLAGTRFSPRDVNAFRMKYLDGLETSVIADQLKMSIASVYTAVSVVRAYIRENSAALLE